MTSVQAFMTLLAVMAGTLVTRFLPFLIFPEHKEPPKFILYLGKVLPAAVIGLLVVYCMKGVELLSSPHGLPEAAAVGVIALLHCWKRNTLLSIGAGTVVYMILVQFVF